MIDRTHSEKIDSGHSKRVSPAFGKPMDFQELVGTPSGTDASNAAVRQVSATRSCTTRRYFARDGDRSNESTLSVCLPLAVATHRRARRDCRGIRGRAYRAYD
jgi:hypothetical protein